MGDEAVEDAAGLGVTDVVLLGLTDVVLLGDDVGEADAVGVADGDGEGESDGDGDGDVPGVGVVVDDGAGVGTGDGSPAGVLASGYAAFGSGPPYTSSRTGTIHCSSERMGSYRRGSGHQASARSTSAAMPVADSMLLATGRPFVSRQPRTNRTPSIQNM